MNEKDYQPAPPNPERDSLFCDTSLKQTCNGYHCRCMDMGGQCPNMHWYHCTEHNPDAYGKGQPNPMTTLQKGCCDGECNHDDCCGKIPENCTHSLNTKTGDWEPETRLSYLLGKMLGEYETQKFKECDETMKEIKDLLRESNRTLLTELIAKCEGMKQDDDLCDFNNGYHRAIADIKSLLENKRDGLI